MAEGGITMDFNKETEYKSKLYKAVLNSFCYHMHAVPLSENENISKLLTDAELERIKKKDDLEGQNASARLLLDFLKTKHNWWDAFMRACDNPRLKIEAFKQKFQELKASVDREWAETHAPNVPAPGSPSGPQLPYPTPALNADIGHNSPNFSTPVQASTAHSGDALHNDFDLSGLQVYNTERLQRDAEEEPVRPNSTGDLQRQMAGLQVGSAPSFRHSQSCPSPNTEPAGDREGNSENTVDHYEPLRPQIDESTYEQIPGEQGLQIDATPDVTQPSDILEAMGREEGQPHGRIPHQPTRQHRRRPQTRQEHPSLSVAISNMPQKDFDHRPVREELSNLPGWKDLQEENEALRQIKPKRGTEGSYIIWYWALAKRPTICVIVEGKVVTFVVHKSASQPTKYYINRHQQRVASLSSLMQYHMMQGIQYRKDNGQEITVLLTHPVP